MTRGEKAGLTRGPLGETCVHVCVDMQVMFVEETPWATPWARRVLPRVLELAEAFPARAIFTRFVPVTNAQDAHGTWRLYYERWPQMTLERLPWRMVELVPELARLAPPALVVDKKVYSPWLRPELLQALQARRADSLVISGGETDICVLATVLGAVDLGYRVVLAQDALCSSSDATHDALMRLYRERYSQQIELADAQEIVDAWR